VDVNINAKFRDGGHLFFFCLFSSSIRSNDSVHLLR